MPGRTGATAELLQGHRQPGRSWSPIATGPAREKALAILDSFYDPEVYQIWINAESVIPTAGNVKAVTGPQSDWPSARHFYDSMISTHKAYGISRGSSITMADQPPIGIETTFKEIMQEMLTGGRDVDAFLKKLDDAWDSLRRAETASPD